MAKWIEVKFQCPIQLLDPVSGALWESGCQGVTEGPPVGESVLLQASFENLGVDQRQQVESSCSQVFLTTDSKAPSYLWNDIQEENWKETHRRFYPPQPLSARFFLVPAWQAAEIQVPAGYEPIVMEPGRAFGTGLHQSTRLALWLMEEYLHGDFLKSASVLDVGTGSGILAMAAAKLGARLVGGTDIDPEAIEVAIENAALNQVKQIKYSTDGLDSFQPLSFQLVVSNILLRTHSELLRGYGRVVTEGGVLILSGLLLDQCKQIEPELKALGFVRNRSKVIDEWEAVAYLRRTVIGSK